MANYILGGKNSNDQNITINFETKKQWLKADDRNFLVDVLDKQDFQATLSLSDETINDQATLTKMIIELKNILQDNKTVLASKTFKCAYLYFNESVTTLQGDLTYTLQLKDRFSIKLQVINKQIWSMYDQVLNDFKFCTNAGIVADVVLIQNGEHSHHELIVLQQESLKMFIDTMESVFEQIKPIEKTPYTYFFAKEI